LTLAYPKTNHPLLVLHHLLNFSSDFLFIQVQHPLFLHILLSALLTLISRTSVLWVSMNTQMQAKWPYWIDHNKKREMTELILWDLSSFYHVDIQLPFIHFSFPNRCDWETLINWFLSPILLQIIFHFSRLLLNPHNRRWFISLIKSWNRAYNIIWYNIILWLTLPNEENTRGGHCFSHW